jgi:hypothetical protein
MNCYVPTASLHGRVYIERQSLDCCALHALNNALQTPLFDHATARATLGRTSTLASDRGWYNANEISSLLKSASGGALGLTRAGLHLGHQSSRSWSQTLAELGLNDLNMLWLASGRVGLPPVTAKHAICAVRLNVDGAGAAWFALDSKRAR